MSKVKKYNTKKSNKKVRRRILTEEGKLTIGKKYNF